MTQPWIIALALEVPKETYEYIKYEVSKLENTIEAQKKEIQSGISENEFKIRNKVYHELTGYLKARGKYRTSEINCDELSDLFWALLSGNKPYDDKLDWYLDTLKKERGL